MVLKLKFNLLIHILFFFFFTVYVCLLEHLVFAGVPVVQQACGDQKGVVLVAALAVVPAAVAADFRLSSGESDWPLTACGGSGRGKCFCASFHPKCNFTVQ